MDFNLFKKLADENFITNNELENVAFQKTKPLSVHWDLRSLLYLGIVLLTGAVGILIYKNIETIGHKALLIFIAAACIGCFIYCFKNSKGYTHTKLTSLDIMFDYVLLLGCLLMLAFIGYVQYQYNIFGNRWGLAAFIPMVILFSAAYYFDHLGVLSMAITNLAAWIGISVTPLNILNKNDFNDVRLIYFGLILGIIILVASITSGQKNIKAHFSFTYKNFGVHILFISLLALMFHYEKFYLLIFLFIAVISFLLFKNALKENSFYFLVLAFLYTYVGLSYVVIQLLLLIDDDIVIYAGFIYFILSPIFLIRLLIFYNKKLKQNARL